MAATKRQLNWTNVTFTPTTGTASTATGVTNVQVHSGANLLKFSGDGDIGPTLIVNDYNEPAITVTCADEAWLMSLVPGVGGSLVCTHKDALGAAGGNITFTLNPCLIESPDASGAHRQIGSGSVKFCGLFVGSTDPLSKALA